MKRHDSWTERIWKIVNGVFANDRKSVRVVNDNESQFGESLVVNRTPIIELNGSYGFSLLRDEQATTGTGTVTSNGTGEILVSSGATTGSSACLESAEIGRYIPGYGAQLGIGARIENLITGDQEARVGGIGANKQNGFYFGVDSTGVFVARRRDGVVKDKTYQPDWNLDPLDGTGDSGVVLTLTQGNVLQIDFTWYGYGQIRFGVLAVVDGKQSFIPCHSLRVDGETSVASPNLKVCVEVDNNTTAEDVSVYVGGRQYSIIGNYVPKYRFTGDFRGDVDTSTTVVPLISFRRKSDFSDRSIKIEGYDSIVTGEPAVMELRLDPTLTNAAFDTPTDYTPSETALESDTSATAIDGGLVLWTQLVEAGQNKNTATLSVSEVDLDIPNGQTITLCARTVANTGSLKSCFRMREEW